MRNNELLNEFGPYTYTPECDHIVGDIGIKNDELLYEFDQYTHITNYEYLKRWDCVLRSNGSVVWIQTDKKN